MSKTLLYWVIGAIIVVGGGWYAWSSMGGGTSGTTTTQEVAASSAMTLTSLMSSGVAQKCTFNDTSSTSQSSGTVYVGGGKVRGDFTAVSEGKTVQAHMISDGTTSYTWIDGMSTGFKMAMTAQTGSASSGQSSQGIDANKQLDYQCTQWAPDATEFQLPASVTFTDMSAMMTGGSAGAAAGASTGASAANCAMCDQAGAGRAQCRAAMGCQ